MKLSTGHNCPICGNKAGGKGHAECSKEIQKMHTNDKRKSNRRAFRPDNAATYFSKVTV